MIKASIIGATGYTGSELIRLLITRDDVQLVHLTSRSHVGKEVAKFFPFLTGLIDQQFVALDEEKIFSESDVVFIGLPHGHSMNIVKQAKNYDVKVIDLGADFRLKDIQQYEETYQVEQTAPGILEEAVFGFSEKYRDEIKDAQIIANPGCFVMSALLGLSPAINEGIVETKSIIIDSKTGVSGAGRSPSVDRLLSELQGNVRAYNVLKHRHRPEIEQELTNISETEVQIQFTPHLLPIERGILSTMYADLKEGQTEESIREIYEAFYQKEPFVHVLPQGNLPETKAVKGTNNCHIQIEVDEQTNRLIILSVIDNLGKGAAGSAVQNMNILFGLPETTGLKQVGLVP